MRYQISYETTNVFYVNADDIAEAARVAADTVDEDYAGGISFRIDLDEE